MSWPDSYFPGGIKLSPSVNFDLHQNLRIENFPVYLPQPVALQPIIDYGGILRCIAASAANASVPSPGKTAFIATFAPEPYVLNKVMPVYIEKSGEEFTATFFDANISISAETEEDAFSDIKSMILDMFDCLDAEPSVQLGPEPLRQIAVLRDFIRHSNAA